MREPDMSTAGTDTIYQMITDKIVKQLQAGTVPWRKPWNDATMPRSINGHVYRGINIFLLASAGYESPYWYSRNMIMDRGGKIKKGEPGTVIIFWKILKVRDKENPDQVKIVPLLRYYKVWNYEQIEGVREPKGGAFPDAGPVPTAEERHKHAAAIVKGYPNRPPVRHYGDRAYYVPSTDKVTVPPKSAFTTGLDEYYSTLFHELGHSTAHSSRLDRSDSVGHEFGSHAYGREELVAEMTAAFLTAESGIVTTHENSAAYLQSWIRTISEDTHAVITAAGRAQKAADHILNRQPAEREQETVAA